jgi:opine dehydrogenase
MPEVSVSTVAVVGAGNVGCALAADLARRGTRVRLYNRSPSRLEAIREAGGITATGEVEGHAAVGVITDSLEEAVDGADVVAVTLPTATLPGYVDALLAATTADQVIWLNPGHTGGALYLSAQAARSGAGRRMFCQLTTASHVSRMIEPAVVRVHLRTRSAVAAHPIERLDECYERLDALLPGQFVKAETTLELDLANINAIMHPPGMVCNAGWIEASGGSFGFYSDGTRAAVSSVIEALDAERLALAERLEVRAVPFVELFSQLGFVAAGDEPPRSVLDALERSALIHPIRSPSTLDHRYLHEDVGWGLVPWLHLAAVVGCPVPTIGALTQLAGVMNGIDYAAKGLTLDRMGLGGMTERQIRSAVIGSPA